ncbi:hypothetical protein ACTI_22340 [Actinoplanes sp. OR16]|uniref:hypothetical protein n=1 Tax=Actinoplanes sp. OR16 TaxID=946334 RepID=UPI000F6D0D4D|nr:hypothetical protein [Actinoplanes sp. OR16]BBH65549.1 hypothetical protein ACTI_22340 [Actinoplanes sp. OR16]
MRPAAVTTAVALLWTMAVAGLVYAIGMVAVTPGTVSRFRDATSGSEVAENFIAVVWLDAAVGAVIALLVVALFTVLGLGLRRGSKVAWGVTLGVCVLGVIGGCGSVAAIGGQQSGEAVPGSLGEALNAAYPGGWIGLNAAVAVAQVIAYILVAFLLLLAPRAFFGRRSDPASVPPGAHGSVPPGAHWSVPPGAHASVPPSGHWSVPPGAHGSVPPGAPASLPPGAHASAFTPTSGSAGNPIAYPGSSFGYANPPSESAVTTSPWAAPQSADQYPHSDQSPSEADQNFVHPPARNPEDEYWSRPSD